MGEGVCVSTNEILRLYCLFSPLVCVMLCYVCAFYLGIDEDSFDRCGQGDRIHLTHRGGEHAEAGDGR